MGNQERIERFRLIQEEARLVASIWKLQEKAEPLNKRIDECHARLTAVRAELGQLNG